MAAQQPTQAEGDAPGGPKQGGMGTQSGEIYLPNYRLGKTLGIGSFGKVKLAEHTETSHKVAVKILNRRRIQQIDMHEKVRREIKILHLFMHPHIIRLYEVIETSHDIFVVMEYVKSGELFDFIVEKGRLHEEEARRFFQQIMGGVEYCHRSMVVHRDLKPENLLLDSNLNIKIADFGLSNMMTDGHFLKTSCGSPNYAAPEVISGRLYAGPEVDVWSCGVILYALLCGSLPFDDENIPTLFKRIKGGIYTIPSHLSPNARDLIPRMLYVDPLKRITIPEIRMHPWFLQNLPRYLTAAPPDPMSQSLKVDEDVLEAVVRMGYDKVQVLEALRTRVCNNATVSYHLMRDNRRNPTSAGGQSVPDGSNHFRTEGPQQQMMRPSQAPQNRPFAQRLVAHRCWSPGLVVTALHPSQILGHLMRVLKQKNILWKKLNPYMYRCRWECLQSSTGKLCVLRFEIAIYRTVDKRYLIDAQILDGPMFHFLTLCSELMDVLRT